MTSEDMVLLSAHIDGELTSAEIADVRLRLMKDQVFRAAYDSMQANDSMLRGFSAQIDAAPVPSNISDLINIEDKPGHQFFERLSGTARIAASFVVALTLGSAVLVFNLFPGEGVEKGTAEYIALNSIESGQSFQRGETVVNIVASFMHQDGRFCREYISPVRHAIACRGDGTWENVVSVDQQNVVNPVQGYVPAGVADLQALDDYVDLHKQGDVLSVLQERSGIMSDWR